MPGGVVRLQPIDIMYVREYEGPGGEAFAELEAGVGLKGRRFYGLFDEGAAKYLACVQRQRAGRPRQPRPSNGHHRGRNVRD